MFKIKPYSFNVELPNDITQVLTMGNDLFALTAAISQ